MSYQLSWGHFSLFMSPNYYFKPVCVIFFLQYLQHNTLVIHPNSQDSRDYNGWLSALRPVPIMATLASEEECAM
jgi:hypothetical protein